MLTSPRILYHPEVEDRAFAAEVDRLDHDMSKTAIERLAEPRVVE